MRQFDVGTGEEFLAVAGQMHEVFMPTATTRGQTADHILIIIACSVMPEISGSQPRIPRIASAVSHTQPQQGISLPCPSPPMLDAAVSVAAVAILRISRLLLWLSFSDIAVPLTEVSDSDTRLHSDEPGPVWRRARRISRPSSQKPQRPWRRVGANREAEVHCEHPSHLLVSSAEAIDRPAVAPSLALAPAPRQGRQPSRATTGSRLEDRPGWSHSGAWKVGIRRKGGSYPCRSLCSGPAHVGIGDETPNLRRRETTRGRRGKATAEETSRQRGERGRARILAAREEATDLSSVQYTLRYVAPRGLRCVLA
jgi:hypothetical protein